MPRFLRARASLGERRASRVLRAGVDALLAATVAPVCAACGTPLEEPSRSCICAICLGTIVPATLPSWTSAHITVGVSGGRYDGRLRDVIHAFKYEGRRSLAAPLAGMMRDRGRDVLAGCDCLVPVPLHPWRRIRRGFNQARDLAERLDRPVLDALWRIRATPSQMALDAERRRTNIRGAFVVSPFVNPATRVFVLVDDVRTTGATIDECGKALLAGGAREVRALTIAIA